MWEKIRGVMSSVAGHDVSLSQRKQRSERECWAHLPQTALKSEAFSVG